MSTGIVVDHKETGVRYAISEHNFNDKIHKYVRDLKPGETVRGFQPKLKRPEEELKLPSTPDPASVADTTQHTDDINGVEKTEGSASAGSKGNK
jgi:hypothetical protein